MIKKITSVLFVAMLFISVSTFAQLSGTYTIGGITPDYATFTDARNALNAQGVSAPVVFNVRSGIYNEQVQFLAVTGASATSTITFQSEVGDSTAAILEFASNTTVQSNYALGLNGADYFIFSKLTVRRTGTNSASCALDIRGGSDINVFSNCVFSNEVLGSTNSTQSVIFSNPNTTDTSNTFNQNVIENGSYGMLYNGTSTVTSYETGTVISNNIFLNQYQRGMLLNYQNGAIVTGNSIRTTSIYKSFEGVKMSNSNGLFNISKNKINCSSGGIGVNIESCTGDTSTNSMLSNNFIAVAGDTLAYGINILTSTNVTMYFNSINITSNDVGNGHGINLDATAPVPAGLTIVNNSIANNGGGYAVYMYNLTNTIMKSMDYNNMYSSGTNVGYYQFTLCANLAAWKASSALDANSQSFDPQYVSASDLHMAPSTLNDFATPIPSITDDIDNDVRNVFTPDIGADEYSAFAEDMSARVILSPVKNSCGSDSTYITAVIRNYGTLDQSNFDVHAEVTGSITNSQVYTYTNTLLAGQSDTITFASAINTKSGATITVTVYTALATDMYQTNDTVSKYFNIFAIPINPVMAIPVPQPLCDNALVTIDGTVSPGEDIVFYNAPVAGNIIHVGHPWVTSFASTTTVYAEARSVTSNIPCLRITECETNDFGTEGDYVEIQNLTTDTIDATGWVVAVSNSSTDPSLVNTSLWNLGIIAPGEVQYRCDACAATLNYWGQNILWDASYLGWAMIVDNSGTVVDFMGWGMDSNMVYAMAPVVNGYNISMIGFWNGDAPASCATQSLQRIGTADNDVAADFACQAQSKGLANANLTVPFASCGLGLCGSDRVPVLITVAAAPVVSLGNDTTVCDNPGLTLNADTGYVSYLWSDGSTNTSIVVNTSGTYWVAVSNGQCTTTDSILVTALVCAAPTAAFSSSDTVFCEKNCLDFTDLSVGATSWNWTFTGASPSSSTLQNPTGICYNNYGTYDITLVVCNSYGCDTLPLTSFITVVQNPTDSIYFSNDTLYSISAYSYQWYSVSTGVITGATNQFFIASDPGDYYCVVSDSIGCIATSNTLTATGITDLANANQFAVFPNPNDGTFEIVLGDKISLDNCVCRIMDAYGKVVYTKKLKTYKSKINLSAAKGIYFVEIESQQLKLRDKFMVK